MELIIDDKYKGNVQSYYQDRDKRRWIFDLENGKQVKVKFDKIKLFTSGDGNLSIITVQAGGIK